MVDIQRLKYPTTINNRVEVSRTALHNGKIHFRSPILCGQWKIYCIFYTFIINAWQWKLKVWQPCIDVLPMSIVGEQPYFLCYTHLSTTVGGVTLSNPVGRFISVIVFYVFIFYCFWLVISVQCAYYHSQTL